MLRATATLSTGPLDGLIAELRPALDAHVAKTALDIQADAQMRAPVRTGTLRRSIAARKLAPLVWLVSVGVQYGLYLEFGTSRMRARPFFTPAIEKHRRPFEDGVRRILRGAA